MSGFLEFSDLLRGELRLRFTHLRDITSECRLRMKLCLVDRSRERRAQVRARLLRKILNLRVLACWISGSLMDIWDMQVGSREKGGKW